MLNIRCIAIVLTAGFFVFLEAKNPCFVMKNCSKSSYILSKNSTINFRKTSLNNEWLVVENCPTPCWITFFFNALSIGVQSTLTFQWNNFDLCLLSDEILVGAISWVLFCNFAVSPLVQKSVLNGEQEQGSLLILYLILTYHVLKGADTAKLQNRTQEIAIHPDHKKIEFIWKGRYL